MFTVRRNVGWSAFSRELDVESRSAAQHRHVTELLAVIVGFVLSKVSDVWTQGRADAKAAMSGRALIELERSSNLALLTDYWNKVRSREKSWFGDDGNFHWVALAIDIAATRIPDFSSLCWTSNVQAVATAYKSEDVKIIWEHYDALSRLTTLWQHLVERNVAAQDAGRHAAAMRNNRGSGFVLGFVSYSQFFKDGDAGAREFITIVNDLLGADTRTFEGKTVA